MSKCPKILGIITKHTWQESGSIMLASSKWGWENSLKLYLLPYLRFRKCAVCGELQGYYQGGASAGWEPVNWRYNDRSVEALNSEYFQTNSKDETQGATKQ